MPGLFLSLDGLDGTGKSTQMRLLATWLRDRGHELVTCHDPGGTPLGDHLRSLVLGKQHAMSLACEAFLFMASRAELVEQVIRPALAAGSTVLSDRFLLANVVYQGHAGGLAPADLWALGRVATGNLEPDLTIVLDLPVEQALARRGRPADRMEDRDRAYLERVRAGFRTEVERRPDRFVIIDATPETARVQEAIRATLTARLLS